MHRTHIACASRYHVCRAEHTQHQGRGTQKGPPAPANRNRERASARRQPHPAPNQTTRDTKQNSDNLSGQRANLWGGISTKNLCRTLWIKTTTFYIQESLGISHNSMNCVLEHFGRPFNATAHDPRTIHNRNNEILDNRSERDRNIRKFGSVMASIRA